MKIRNRNSQSRVHTTDTAQESAAAAKPGAAAARDEAGAVIILALVFLVTVGLVITALVSEVGSDLVNTSHFNTDRSLVYASGSATEVAMWSARYSYTTGTNVACPGTNPPISVDGVYVEDWCSTVSAPGSAATRVVTLSACVLPSSVGLASVCGSPYLQAVVTFNDFNDLNVNNCTALVQGSCGTGMTLNSWAVK